MNATMSLQKTKHYPVMLNQVLSIISPQHGGSFIDCTFGGGGYSEAILKFWATGKMLTKAHKQNKKNKKKKQKEAVNPDIAERAAVLANLKKQIALAKVNAQRAATIKAQDKIKEVKE